MTTFCFGVYIVNLSMLLTNTETTMRITVTSSLNEITTDRPGVGGGVLCPPPLLSTDI
jgi:hypothetical protein